ncbi:hypothetical protein [Mediterraneibacter gnavus]|uniref:hypothetical protein n=1 Tax=Mediterraneibacter gnavus TaxID=33038 RepID=UPI00356A5D2B
MIGNEKLATYYNHSQTLPKALFDATIGTFIYRPLLNTPLWTIKYEFLGIIFGKIIAEIWKKQKYVLIVLLICGEYMLTRDIYYILISMGVVLFSILYVMPERIKYNKFMKMSFRVLFGLLMIILLSGYDNFWIRCLCIFSLVVLLECDIKLQRIFENKILVRLSKYTYAVYAVHWPIICSFGCYTYITQKKNFIVTFFATMLLIGIIAIVVEYVNSIICNRIMRKELKYI